MAIGAIIGAASSAIGGIIGGIGARKAARKAARQARSYQRKLDTLVANRQDILDPTESITDRSNIITNPFANLQVATQAAEFQAEEADLSLANTLDTMRATGAGAGGATALAQAALRSKRGISASIEQQEARNILLRAQGAQTAEARRLSEGARVDRARMLAEQFSFQAQEARDIAKMDRLSALAQQAEARGIAQRQAAQQGFGQAFGAVLGVGAGVAAGKGTLSQRLGAMGFQPGNQTTGTIRVPDAEADFYKINPSYMTSGTSEQVTQGVQELGLGLGTYRTSGFGYNQPSPSVKRPK